MATALRRLAWWADRAFDRGRHAAAFEVSEDSAVDGDLRSLRGHPYALLITFRRDGSAVPSPVWFAIDGDGRAFVKTAEDVGKVRRIRRDGRVLMAPATARGKPVGPALRGRARVLPPEEWPDAERTLAASYGLSRRLSERLLGGAAPAAYLEITPRSRASET